MHILSAIDAISPAIARTRDLLFRPFRWGTFLKLSAVAVFTERLAGRGRLWNGGGSGQSHLNGGPVITSITPPMIVLIVCAAIAVLVIALVIYYFATRLRFALFECLTHQSTEIRPGWHIYRQPANRFYWLTIGVGVGFFAVAALVLSPSLLGMFRRLQEHAGQRFDFGIVLEFLLPMIPILVLLGLLAFAADIILRDFMLPHIALDNATAGEALEAVWNHIAAEKGSFFLYAVMRVLLPLAAIIALAIALIIPGVILFGGGGILIAALKAAEVHATAGVAFGAVLLQVLIVIAMVALAMFLAIIFGGPLSIALRNYALVFYGARYPALGETMFPPHTTGPGAGLPA